MWQIHSIGACPVLLKSDATVSINEQGQIRTSINILNVFINEVHDQNGNSIDSEFAEHMMMYVKSVSLVCKIHIIFKNFKDLKMKNINHL